MNEAAEQLLKKLLYHPTPEDVNFACNEFVRLFPQYTLQHGMYHGNHNGGFITSALLGVNGRIYTYDSATPSPSCAITNNEFLMALCGIMFPPAEPATPPIAVDKWDIRFIELAKHISTWSKDPSTRVAALIVDSNNNVRAIGYNGFARKVDDTDERLNNRELKYPMMVHAEANALTSCSRLGIATDGCYIISTLFPCSTCAGQIINAGITKVITVHPTADQLSRWKDGFNLAETMFKEAGVEIIMVD